MAHSSEPPSPWEGYKRCLSDLPASGHVLVIQDDVSPVPGFSAALNDIAGDDPVCLFLGSQPRAVATMARRAHQRGQRYVVLPRVPFVPIPAVLWPVPLARDFLAWAESGVRLPGHPAPRADDAVLSQWHKATGQTIKVTVPSLVEHLGVPSTKGKSNVENWRAFALATNALDYEW